MDPLVLSKGIFYFRTGLLLFLFATFSPSYSQPKIELKESKKNFGFVKRGEVIVNNYELTNSGDQPLLISDVEVSCSCTTVDFPKHPVLPGQKAIIAVTFNTATTYGRQDRVVIVKSNSQNGDVKLRYKGIVSNK
jgi:hypothetical protein